MKKKEEGQSSDDFGTLFGTNADLAAVALAVYTIVVTVRNSPDLFSDEVIGYLETPQDFFALATIVLLVGPWAMLMDRALRKEMPIPDLLFKSYYTSTFWGIIFVLIGFLCVVSSGV